MSGNILIRLSKEHHAGFYCGAQFHRH